MKPVRAQSPNAATWAAGDGKWGTNPYATAAYWGTKPTDGKGKKDGKGKDGKDKKGKGKDGKPTRAPSKGPLLDFCKQYSRGACTNSDCKRPHLEKAEIDAFFEKES